MVESVAKTEEIKQQPAVLESIAQETGGMSKNKQKKLKKKENWAIKKAELKASGQFKKQKKKKNVETYNHLRRFNDLSGVDDEGNSRKLSKKEK